MFTAQKSTKLTLLAALAAAYLIIAADSASAQRRKATASRLAAGATTTLPQARSPRSTEQTVTVHVDRYQEYKPSLRHGDREFGGHGPEVWVYVQFFVQQNSIYRRIRLVAMETDGGTSQAAGWSDNHFVYRPPYGKTIKAIRGHNNSQPVLHMVTRGHKPTIRNTSVGKVTVWGDQNGTDIEVYTKLRIDFDFDLQVELSGDPLLSDEARLPASFKLTPQHVKGDKDFKGKGPHVYVDAQVSHDTKRAYLSMYMNAQEAFGGTTRAAGSKTVLFYTAPIGYKITAVRGKKLFPKIIKYSDKDHSLDRFDTELGPAIVKGDRRGDDAGVYTSVQFLDIRRRVIISLVQISK